VRYWSLILWMSAPAGSVAAAPPSAEAAMHWESDGRSRFLACDFKQATQDFEKAVAWQPDRAVLHFWLGKSYARLAEISGPLSAPRHARRARRCLERAVALDPQNHEYREELFDFYLDSPEWFGGGLKRAAALLERTSPRESGAEPQWKQLADSRQEHSGGGWWIRKSILWTSGAIGVLVPQP
jgi:tetratricopeptide (TPR) repeat protein